MAYGSFAAFRRYVNKVFQLEEALGHLKDGRTSPTVPLAAILTTWLWAMARRLPSTEQVGDLLKDPRWRQVIGLSEEDGGSPDTAGRALDGLSIDEINELHLEAFFAARRAGILKDDGPYGKRCAIVDLNELFKSEKRHCADCQVRNKEVVGEDGQKRIVQEHFHQAVALVWAGTEVAWPINWELLKPGEGELTAALRMLGRLLPRLRKSLDFLLGDSLYCCRPFFQVAIRHGIVGLAISSGQTEMDEEMDLLMKSEPPRRLPTLGVDVWELQSEAWEKDVHKLRVLQCERHPGSGSL